MVDVDAEVVLSGKHHRGDLGNIRVNGLGISDNSIVILFDLLCGMIPFLKSAEQ
jgi:hypothetical protein